MRLTPEEMVLLRKLLVRGDQEWKVGLNRGAFDGLQVLGYAKRTGLNGCGHWVKITPRGILKAMSCGMIGHHPGDPEPAWKMLRKDRLRAEINR